MRSLRLALVMALLWSPTPHGLAWASSDSAVRPDANVINRVRPLSAEIRTVTSADLRRQLVYCEMGRCRPIGSTQGYRPDVWAQIGQLCLDRSRWQGPSQILVQTLIVLAAVRTGSGLLYMLGGAGMGDLSTQGEHSARGADWETAGQRLPGLMRENESHMLSIDAFVSLRNGLRSCVKLYEDRRIFQRLLQVCPNPLICSAEAKAWAERPDDEA